MNLGVVAVAGSTLCVCTERLFFFLVLHCCELNEVSHWHRNSLWIIQLQKTTISRGTVGVLQVVKWKQNCKCILIEARCFAPPICNGERWSLSQVIVKTAISICRCEKCFSALESCKTSEPFFVVSYSHRLELTFSLFFQKIASDYVNFLLSAGAIWSSLECDTTQSTQFWFSHLNNLSCRLKWGQMIKTAAYYDLVPWQCHQYHEEHSDPSLNI